MSSRTHTATVVVEDKEVKLWLWKMSRIDDPNNYYRYYDEKKEKEDPVGYEALRFAAELIISAARLRLFEMLQRIPLRMLPPGIYIVPSATLYIH